MALKCALMRIILRIVAAYDALAEKVVYTGTIDAYFDYKCGELEYRSLRFETEVLDTPNYQGVAVVNYTDRETPYTRIIEHKHFAFGHAGQDGHHAGVPCGSGSEGMRSLLPGERSAE